MTATLAPAAPPAAGSSAGRFVADTLTFARRNIEHIRQIPEKLLDVTLQPLMFTVLFAYVFGGAIAIDGGSYREYLLGGILVQTITFFMMGPGMAIADDLKEGAIDRFRSLPASRSAYLAGHYLAEMAGGLLSITIMLSVGLVIGWRAHAPALDVVQALALLVVFLSAMIWLGTTIGMLVRSSEAVQGLAFVLVFPLTFMSSAFVPVTTMPNVLQWIAAWNPVTTMASAVRVLFGNPQSAAGKDIWPVHHPVAAAWLYSVGLLLIGVTAAVYRFKSRTTE